jgi:hypothetical protein
VKSLIFGVTIVLVTGCSSISKHSTGKKNTNLQCDDEGQSIVSRHIALQVSSQKNRLVHCFKNFLQFEENKEQTIHVCNNINVARSGKVTYAKVNGIKLPKDLKMCLEQQLWTMNFRAIQPTKNISVRFPITFRSK